MLNIFSKSLILMFIAGISGFFISMTFQYTGPKILKHQNLAMEQAKREIGGYSKEVTVKGYGGDIKMLVGIDKQGKVKGVKILSMNETPGLGSLATSETPMKNKPFTFLGQFIGKGKKNKLRAKEDIVAITGATITSQAIADGVKLALQDQ